MSMFRADLAGIEGQKTRMAALADDVDKASAYTTTNIVLSGNNGVVLGKVLPGVATARTAIEEALAATKSYLDGSARGLGDALTEYRKVDRAKAEQLDRGYPVAGPRPRWQGPASARDTKPGPSPAPTQHTAPAPPAASARPTGAPQPAPSASPSTPSATPGPSPKAPH